MNARSRTQNLETMLLEIGKERSKVGKVNQSRIKGQLACSQLWDSPCTGEKGNALPVTQEPKISICLNGAKGPDLSCEGLFLGVVVGMVEIDKSSIWQC